MPPADTIVEFNQAASSYFILAVLAGVAAAAGALFYIGVLGWVIGLAGAAVHALIRAGFRCWRLLFGWASWQVFLSIEIGWLFLGWAVVDIWPTLALACGLAPLLMGLAACLAFMFIDLERYAVERGYKTIHKPVPGQELAHDLIWCGDKVDVPLLGAAAVGVIAGFALLNLGLSRTIGAGWYRLIDDQAGFADFLAYALVNLYNMVDLLDIANAQHLVRTAHVKAAKWPASTLLTVFKLFFTLVLLQQIFASIRKGRLLAEMISDFWSPHEPIHQRARSALPQFGAGAVGPLLVSLRSVAALTKEQRDQLPLVLATMGPAAVATLVRHLHDPHEHVRAVAAAGLGHLQAAEATGPLCALLADASDIVRQSAVSALGAIASAGGKPARKKRRIVQVLRPVGRGLTAGFRFLTRRPTPLPPPDCAELAVATLRRALGDATAAVRTQAAVALGRIGPDAAAAVSDLIPLLQDADETVRCRAAEALGSMPAQAAAILPPLSALLHDGSAAVKAAAARGLGALRKEAASATPTLIALLQDSADEVRAAAAEAVAQIGRLTDAATDSLVEGLTDPDNVVRAQTAEALGVIGAAAQDAAPALVEVVRNGDDRVRAKAVRALGMIGEAAAEVAVPSLVRALRGQDSWVSALAAEALGQMGDSADEAVPALARSLQHRNPLVRANAAEALANLGDSAAGARAELERTARDEDGGVRRQALRALGAIGGPTAAAEQAVQAGLADDDPLVRAAAVETLGRWNEPTQVDAATLLALLADANDHVKVQVVQVLPRLAGPTPAVIAGLCQRLLKDDSPWVKEQAAAALGRLGQAAADAGPDLLRVVQTGELEVREEALRAVIKIQPPELATALAAGLKDACAEIRKVASGGWLKAVEPGEPAVAALVAALRDPEVRVRANVAGALARLAELPEAAVPGLLACAAEADEGLRLNAALALRSAAGAEVQEVFHQLLTEDNPRLQLLAAGFLLENDPADRQAAAVVVNVLAAPTFRLGKVALELLAALPPAPAQLVREMLDEHLLQVQDRERQQRVQQMKTRLEECSAVESATPGGSLTASACARAGTGAPKSAPPLDSSALTRAHGMAIALDRISVERSGLL